MVVGDQDKIDRGELLQRGGGGLEAGVDPGDRGGGLGKDRVKKKGLPFQAHEEGGMTKPDKLHFFLRLMLIMV